MTNREGEQSGIGNLTWPSHMLEANHRVGNAHSVLPKSVKLALAKGSKFVGGICEFGSPAWI
jgi:hypothetical protein